MSKSKLLFTSLAIVISTLVMIRDTWGWGFFAHKWINRLAVDALPAEVRPFFEQHRDYLSEHAVDPDLWRDNDAAEHFRHFIDIDLYGPFPFKELPRDFEAAKQKFGEKTVIDRGIAPWWIEKQYDRLVQHMKSGKTDSLLVVAAALGHYVSDLHMPLHTVENYDGQLTGNTGIHSRFEWQMIERFSDRIHLTPEAADYLDDARTFAFNVVIRSYRLADELLRADTDARTTGRVYGQPEDFDNAYYLALFSQAGELAEKQMCRAVTAVASIWYSAWIDAGKPTLSAEKAMQNEKGRM
ncbi:MAG TPA: S1/P1 nuclease [bacterium]